MDHHTDGDGNIPFYLTVGILISIVGFFVIGLLIDWLYGI